MSDDDLMTAGESVDVAALRRRLREHEDNAKRLYAEIERLRANAAPAARQILSQQAEIERLRQANVTWAHDTIKLITAIKYLIGIAERGEGREINSNETAEGFVLAYVKKLESEIERLRRELAQTKARLKPIDRALAAVADRWVEIETARNLLRETTGRQSDE